MTNQTTATPRSPRQVLDDLRRLSAEISALQDQDYWTWKESAESAAEAVSYMESEYRDFAARVRVAAAERREQEDGVDALLDAQAAA